MPIQNSKTSVFPENCSCDSDIDLYVSGLPPEITVNSLKNLFCECGTVTRVKLLPIRNNEFSTKAGFVCFATDEEAKCAISNFNGIKLDSHPLSIKYSTRKVSEKGNSNNFQELLNKLEKGPLNDDDVKLLLRTSQTADPSKKFEGDHDNNDFSPSYHSSSGTKTRNRTSSEFYTDIEVSPEASFSNRKISTQVSAKKIGNCGDASFSKNAHFKNKFNHSKYSNFSEPSYQLSAKTTPGFPATVIKPEMMDNLTGNGNLNKYNFKDNERVFVKTKLDVIPQFLSNVEPGSLLNIKIIDINAENSVMIGQRADDEVMDSLTKLQVALNSYKGKNKKRLEAPSVGDACAALFSGDNQWYRAIIEKISEHQNAHVLFVDYGNRDIIDCRNLLCLNEHFIKLPTFSFMCKFAETDLHNLSEKQLEILCSILQENRMLLQVKCAKIANNYLYGTFVAGKLSINDLLGNNSPKILKQDECNFTEDSHNIQHVTNSSTAAKTRVPCSKEQSAFAEITDIPTTIIPDGKFQILISSVVNPSSFYCQIIRDDLVKLFELLQSLTDYMKSIPHISDFHPETGNACAAIFDEDGKWYRGQILVTLPKQRYLIYFIDYGNTCNIERHKIQPLLKKFATLPIQAFHACLAGCFPKENNIWCEKAIDYIKSLQMKPMDGEIAIHENDISTRDAKPVKVYLDKMEVNSILVMKGFAKTYPPNGEDLAKKNMDDNGYRVPSNLMSKTGKAFPSQHVPDQTIEKQQSTNSVSFTSNVSSNKMTALRSFNPQLNKKLKISITCSNDFGVFHCHVINDSLNTLCDVVSELTLYAIKNPCVLQQKPVPGMLVSAYCEDDQTWCRAIVLACSGNNVKVKFVDYGNCEELTLSEVLFLPDKFTKLPTLALPCVLASMRPVGAKWDDNFTQSINKCIGKKLDAVFVGKDEENNYLVLIPFFINVFIKQDIGVFSLDSHLY